MSNIITGGMIAVEDGLKSPVEYQPPRKIRVELRFDVPEGSSGDEAEKVMDAVAQMADRKVKELLSLVPNGKDKLTLKALEDARTVTTVEGEKKRGPRTTAQKAAEEKLIEQAKEIVTDAKAGENRAKQIDIEESIAAIKSAEAMPDDDLAFLNEDAPPEITDADLRDVLTRKNSELNDGPRLRKLVQEYTSDGTASAAKIPQAVRAKFVAAAKELK